MGTIQGVTRFTIHAGALEEFKRLAAEAVRLTREKDTGTLRYEFFFNLDETECVLHGEYVDFDASVQHFKNMAPPVPPFLRSPMRRMRCGATRDSICAR